MILATSCDFPALGSPTIATWPAPSLSIIIDARCPPLFLVASCVSLAIRLLNSARRWSVPLCLGIIASISSRPAIFSVGLFAARKVFSASKYCGGKLAGTYKDSFTFLARLSVIPPTAASSATPASLTARTEPNTFSRACFRFGPMPGTSSKAEAKVRRRCTFLK